MSEVVRIERHAGWALVVIDHPPANAIDRRVVAGVRELLREAAGSGARAAVVTGAGDRHFSAGADVNEFGAHGPEFIAEGQDLGLEIEALDIPVIAAVNGNALGGGCELAMACDLRIAATTARFGQPEINLGIIPGWGGTQRLPIMVGRTRAMWLLLTGGILDAAQALAMGLVNEVVEPERLLARAGEMAETLAGKAPCAVAATKRAVVRGAGRPLRDGLEVERAQFLEVLDTEDAREGVSAFLAKRPPQWRGR